MRAQIGEMPRFQASYVAIPYVSISMSLPTAKIPRGNGARGNAVSDLTIVIPCRNEEARLKKTLQRLNDWVSASGSNDIEVLIVIEPSKDKTTEVAMCCMTLFPALDIRVIKNLAPHGKGFAVRVGLRNAYKKFVMFMDADGAVPMPVISDLHGALLDGADVVIGSRRHRGSQILKHQPASRELGGQAFNTVMRYNGFITTQDSQCGFKGFTVRAAEYLSKYRSNGFGFDVEILYLATMEGMSIVEIPVAWEDNPASSLTIKSGITALGEALVNCWAWRIQFMAKKPRKKDESLKP